MATCLPAECVSIDVDTQLTMLQDEAISEEVPEMNDEIEDLRNSLREAVHNEAVRPKLQCLMMDPSFSMVTVQSEDSGILWETTSSRCSTPMASEAGNTPSEFCYPIVEGSVTPGSEPAGRIIFVMDEEQIFRRKRSKGSGRRSRAGRQNPLATTEDSGEVTGRPELVEVSLPNVRAEGEGEGEEAKDPLEEKDQRLFRLVSEGSEILNIFVQPKLVTVDEEESTEMVDNLSYLEESPITKPSEMVFEPNMEVNISDQGDGGDKTVTHTKASQPIRPGFTDHPGAPVPKPQRRGATGDTDYFEKFTLVDAHAPGSPAVVTVEQEEEPETDAEEQSQANEQEEQPKDNSAPVAEDLAGSEGISGEELASELLDDVFYGGIDDMPMKPSILDGEESNTDENVLSKSPLKKSGSVLFDNQEDILTPIFLSPGPPKIIDPSLLEEPTAMAFLYTDLYEEAVGSRMKDEDAESMTSEKSFHSRNSDREDRGYLEKFVLKDETPVLELEVEAQVINNRRKGHQMWSQDSHDLTGLSRPETEETEGVKPEAEEEITDFFRTSANSTPCAAELFPPSLEEEGNDTPPVKKHKVKAERNGDKTAQEVPQPQADEREKTREEESEARALDELTDLNEPPPLCDTSYELAGGRSVTTEQLIALEKPQECIPPITNQEAPKPVAPPRKKTTPPKTSLDLAPLTPVETTEEGEGGGGKEQRKEEKEKASPAETADEGEGDGEETEKVPPVHFLSSPDQSQGLPSETELLKGEDIKTETVEGETKPPQAEENECHNAEIQPLKGEGGKNEAAKGETEPEKAETESAEPQVEPVIGGSSLTETAKAGASECPPSSVTEPAKESSRCIIL